VRSLTWPLQYENMLIQFYTQAFLVELPISCLNNGKNHLPFLWSFLKEKFHDRSFFYLYLLTSPHVQRDVTTNEFPIMERGLGIKEEIIL
jgi:hypothetical protein